MLSAPFFQEHRMSHRVIWLAAFLALVRPGWVFAQGTPLSEILVRLIQSEVQLAGPPPGSPFPSHAAHFLPGEDAQLSPYLFNQAIVSQLSTFPIGSSAGGFSYTFDPALGTYNRSTTSFGPLFAERAVTLGRGRWSVGGNYQHARFNSFEGKDLDSGDIRFYLTHLIESGAFFEGDLVGTSLKMELTTDTLVLFASRGITNRLDLGVAVPVSRVDLQADVTATILRLATLDTGATSGIHTFSGGGSTATFSRFGTASGIGDILLRSKYRFFERANTALAAVIDLRLPTGDEENLLGTGATQAKFLLVGSTVAGGFSPHLNIGYTVSDNSSSSVVNTTDDFNYAFGTEFTPHANLTIVADLLGRQLRGSGRLVEQPRTFNWRTQAGVTGSSTFNEFALRDGNLTSVFTALGAKFNPTGNLLISASVLFPLNDAGIRSGPVPVIGFEYAF
jgi:hypothetical protein